jgi:putative phage-type endonuclease
MDSTHKSEFTKEGRTTFIGGSEVADVFCLEPYGCQRKLYYEKTGQEPDYPDPESYHMRRGKLLEPIAAMLYETETGRTIRRSNARIVDVEYGMMVAHLDREILKDERGVGVLELKCPSVRTYYDIKKKGAQEGYILQMQHYMRVRKAQWGSYGFFSAELAELFHFDVLRDEELIEKIIVGELAFWEMVKRHEMPEPLPSEKDKRCKKCVFEVTCRELKPGDEELDPSMLTMISDVDFEGIIPDYWEAKSIFDDAEEYLDGIKDRIRGKMEEHQVPYALVKDTKVYYPTLDGRATWDTKRLAKDFPQLEKQYKKQGKPYKRLSLYHSK